MPDIAEMRRGLRDGRYDGALSALYGDLKTAVRRAEKLIEMSGREDDTAAALFSAPGRTEIGGNHTDHNRGVVLAGAVDMDTMGLAWRTNAPEIRIRSAGFSPNTVRLDDLSPGPAGGLHTSDMLIRGVCAGFRRIGRPIGGFDAVTVSGVPPGSGLSSSAAFENLVGVMLDHLYGRGDLDPMELARIGQYAENVYAGKPSGLMDQTVSAVGGMLLIDFENPERPVVESVEADMGRFGHTVFITGPIGHHADLTPEYASIPNEMRQVAWALGYETLRGVTPERFAAALPSLWEALPGRALLRAYHFIYENERPAKQAAALKKGDFKEFLRLVNESGHSSYMYLQNVVTEREQGLGVALMMSETLLRGHGAQRVHGGGFAGTVQAFVPDDMAEMYKAGMEAVFGEGKCTAVKIRRRGAVRVI